MKLHEVQDGLVIEQDFGLHVVVVLPLVEHHHRDEIDEPDRGHLVLIDLSPFDGN